MYTSRHPDLHGDRDPFAKPPVRALSAAPVLDAPTVEMSRAFQRVFDYFNVELFAKVFGQPLPQPVLNLSRKRGAVAFFWAKSWKDPQTGAMLDEISLVPEWTARETTEVFSTLCHEMAHQLDHINGTAAKGAYHGRSWFKLMARLGLPGKPLSKSMLKVTHEIDPDGPFMEAYRAMPYDLALPFTTARPAGLGLLKLKDTLQGKRARYQCPVCSVTMRGPTGRRIHCVDCDEPYHETGF